MTKKDFRAIAAILAGDYATCNTDGERYKVRGIALSLADYFQRANPSFDRTMFYRVIGI